MNGVLRVQAQRMAETGAEYLDREAAVRYPEIVPVRWYNVIDLNVLNVQMTTRCVLAQLGQASRYNLLHYAATAIALGMDPYPDDYDGDAFQRGFHVIPGDWAHEEYHRLTVAWKWLILQRRAAEPALSLVALAS